MTRWKRLRYRFEEFACQAVAHLIPRLSRRACVRVADCLGGLAFAIDRRGRTVALANLECALGPKFTAGERREIARKSYRNFVRTMLDLFWAARVTRENFAESFRVEGF